MIDPQGQAIKWIKNMEASRVGTCCILVLQEYWVLAEYAVPLRLVLVGVWGLLHFPLVLMIRHNETGSAVFLYYRFSLFLKDPFFFQNI